MNGFKKAVKHQSKLRLALVGLAGSGKSWSSLAIAEHLVPNGRVAVIDTERGSASLYSDRFSFDVLELERHRPDDYVEAIVMAEKAEYDVIVVDSLSHAWSGRDGALEQVDKIAKREGKANNFTAWRDVTPQHNRLVDTILSCKAHVICSMRSKMEYSLEKDEKGKSTVRKVGLEPIQRSGLDYEFTIVGDLNLDHQLVISKSRCAAVEVGSVIDRPGEKLARTLREWLNSGATVEPPTAKAEDRSDPRAALDSIPDKIANELDAVFGAYLRALQDAPDVASLDKAATGPAKPAKGTEEHRLATQAYLRRRKELESNGQSKSAP